MKIRWTDDAIAELNEIVDFLDTVSLSYSRRVAQEIYDETQSLTVLSHRYRLGPTAGTRERVLASSGYIITYEVVGDGVFILGLHHGAEDRPRR